MKTNHNSFYVITGGPGVGKTTLIAALHAYGFQIVEEDARRIIKNQIETKSEGVPWKNKILYAQLMFEASLKSYTGINRQNNSGTIFFDRGILDAVCYMKMEKIPVPKKITEQVKQHVYNRKVFILPPWKEIYETDSERKQNWDEAEQTFNEMKATYISYGYVIIEVPRMTTEERLQFILQHIHHF